MELSKRELDSKKYGIWLWALSGLFTLRVASQLLQLKLDISFLPEFDAWHSGVLPYEFLLLSQLIILSVYCWVAYRFTTLSVQPSALVARVWLLLGCLYMAVMIGRLTIGLSGLSSNPWFSYYLPTFFHFVLAGFMLVVGVFHLRHGR